MTKKFEHAVLYNGNSEEFAKLLTNFTDDGWTLCAYSTAPLGEGRMHYSAVMQREKKGEVKYIPE